MDRGRLAGITVTPVKGLGEYRDAIEETIVRSVCTEYAGDGLVAVVPVERIVRIRTREDADPATL